jgi:hypothetical protein
MQATITTHSGVPTSTMIGLTAMPMATDASSRAAMSHRPRESG